LRKALWNLKSKRIAIWGLSFKPNTDDIREAPSIKIVNKLLSEGAIISAYDPKAMENFKKIFPQLYYGNDKYDILKDTNALLIVTEWQDFKEVDFQKLKDLMRTHIIVDGRNLYECEEVKKYGFEYYPTGRICL
jgi:UDPglucose 6-dehydrogenase